MLSSREVPRSQSRRSRRQVPVHGSGYPQAGYAVKTAKIHMYYEKTGINRGSDLQYGQSLFTLYNVLIYITGVIIANLRNSHETEIIFERP
jgi:hypothetical protein